MDGDATAKVMDKGANSAIRQAEGSDVIHESSRQIELAGQKTQGTGTSAFHKNCAIGSMFKADGAIGGIADEIGRPFWKDGAIGKTFNEDGKIAGTIHENLGNKE